MKDFKMEEKQSLNELFHAGRKGMKWGKHIFTKLNESYDKLYPDLDTAESKTASEGQINLTQILDTFKRPMSKETFQKTLNEYNAGVNAVVDLTELMSLSQNFNGSTSDMLNDKTINDKLDKLDSKYSNEDFNFKEAFKKEFEKKKILEQIEKLESVRDSLLKVEREMREADNRDEKVNRKDIAKLMNKISELNDKIDALYAKSDPFINHSLKSSEFSLSHFGILGMKWGVRKDDTAGVKALKALAGNQEALNSATTQEINDIVNRVNAERNLATLMAKINEENPTLKKRITGFLGGLAKKGIESAQKAATDKMADYISKALKDKDDLGAKMKGMTDAELATVVARQNLEKKFREAMSKK